VENRPGRKFCANCGSALAVACPNCGAANEPGDRFCGECGTALAEGVVTPERAETNPLSPRESEILALVAKGLSNKEVSNNLGISIGSHHC